MTFYIGQKKAGEIFLGDKKIGRVYLGQKLVHMTQKAGGRFVESIVFDGASYIDTTMLSTPKSKWEADFQSSKAVGETFQSIFSAQANFTQKRISCIIIGANTATRFVLSGTMVSISDKDINFSSVADANNRHTYGIDVKSYTAYVDSATVKGTPVANMSTDYPVYVMARNSSGTATNFSKGKLYGFRHWEDDVLVQDLRPYVDSNGVACFKDVVTDTLFYNKGTGILTYTE